MMSQIKQCSLQIDLTMTKREYYSLLEDIKTKKATLEKAEWLRKILEVYPQFGGITLCDVMSELKDRAANMENRIQAKVLSEKSTIL